MSSEAKVGLFFLVAILLVGFIALYLSDYLSLAQSYKVTVYFRNVQGLSKGNQVRMAGVPIGRVKEIYLALPTEAATDARFKGKQAGVTVLISRTTKLYKDDRFVIRQAALLGDTYLEVERTTETPQALLENGAVVPGEEPIGVADLSAKLDTLISKAQMAVDSVNRVISSEANQQRLQQILINVVSATSRADRLAAQATTLAGILTRNAREAGPDITRMAHNLADASLSVRNSAQMVRMLLATTPIPRDMAVATGNIRQATQDMAAMSNNLAQVFASPETRGQVQDAIGNLHQATANLASLTKQANALLEDGKLGADIKEAVAKLRDAAVSVANITGNYEKVLNDPAFTGDVRATVGSARKAAENSARVVEQAEQTLQQVDQTMDKVTGAVRSIKPDEVRTRVTLETTSGSGLRTDYDVDLQYGTNRDRFWRLGIRDIGDHNSLNLQRSFNIPGGRGRVGLFGGKLGVGYDLHPQDRLGAEIEVYQPKDLRLDLRGIYRFGTGSDILFGFSDIGQDSDPFIGVRYHTNP